ncbi:hypothetical protein KBY55_09420 [Streptomyces sp. b94]|uniref:hypothetical protein n=1 Tax=Streptomyces sp. b94 TaxID=1827634 RepID=UPI001B3687D3|nr:hypothetical protein [Streptomyces sp. b94]MBQ1096302.1 hypothetical protein [Streptomyces sp. b94]
MPDRIALDLAALWDRIVQEPGALRTALRWMRLNRIDPDTVPVHSTMVFEDSAFGPVIRYDAFLTTPDGRHYLDPVTEDRAATQRRTALLWQEPPLEWLTVAGGEL